MSYGVPKILYPNSMTSAQQLYHDTSMAFDVGKRGEIFYSIKNGNWNDITVWETVSGTMGKLPTANDDVYIRHTVTINIGSPVCNNLFISGTLNVSNAFTLVLNNIQCVGVLDLSQGSQAIIQISGNNNYIANFLSGTNSTIQYLGSYGQYVLNIPYYSLTVSTSGIAYLIGNTIVNGVFTVQTYTKPTTLETGQYTLTVNGTTVLYSGTLSNAGGGNMLFVGLVTYGAQGGTFNFTGNPNVEFRGGISAGLSSGYYTGTGNWTFTTNNQTITLSVNGTNGQWDCAIVIDSGITVTMLGSTSNSTINISNSINGNSSSSTMINKTGGIYFVTSTAGNAMTTGIFDTYTYTNLIGYNYNGSGSVYQTSLSNLSIQGTGTKTLIGNTSLSGNLTYVGTSASNTILQVSSYNFSINGTTTFSAYSSMLASGSGTITFGGAMNFVQGNQTAVLDFSVGNPSVVMKGGLAISGGWPPLTFKTGTGTWTFTTNNQNLSVYTYTAVPLKFDGPMIVSGAITVSLIGAGGSGSIQINNSLTGNNASSNFVVGSNSTYTIGLWYNTSSISFGTGTIDVSSHTDALVGYVYSSSMSLPLTSYNHVLIAGTGTKTLSGTTTVNNLYIDANGTYSFGNNAILECSSYGLTVNGITSITAGSGQSAWLKKNSSTGSVLFVGQLNPSTNNSGTSSGLDFSVGNPNVECRGGIYNGFGYSRIYPGTGTWSFTTNAQTITENNSADLWNCIFSIVGIALTVYMNANSQFIVSGVINGTNSSSSLIVKGTSTLGYFQYNNAIRPMITGTMDASSNLNLFVYGGGNQDILGGPTTGSKQQYYHLTLNGGAVTKTLQGYVSVLHTYTLTSPTVLNNNGYTLTNP